jgi:CRP-like cAMP-binding protein
MNFMEIIQRNEETIKKVKDMSIFRFIPQEEFKNCQNYINIIRFKKGEDIIRQGEITGGIFIVLAGKVSVIRDSVKLSELEKGEIFGEGEILLGRPASATIKAEEDGTEVAYIIRGALEALEKSAPRFTTIFYKTIARILMERLINLDREYVNIASKLKNTEEAQKSKELREKIFKTLK